MVTYCTVAIILEQTVHYLNHLRLHNITLINMVLPMIKHRAASTASIYQTPFINKLVRRTFRCKHLKEQPYIGYHVPKPRNGFIQQTIAVCLYEALRLSCLPKLYGNNILYLIFLSALFINDRALYYYSGVLFMSKYYLLQYFPHTLFYYHCDVFYYSVHGLTSCGLC